MIPRTLTMSSALQPPSCSFCGLDDLAFIESACFHYPKNQKLSFSLFSNYAGNTKGGRVFEWAADPEGPAALCTQGFIEYIGKNHNFKIKSAHSWAVSSPEFREGNEVFAQFLGGELGRDVGGNGVDGDAVDNAVEVAAGEEGQAFAGREEARDLLRVAVNAPLAVGQQGESVCFLPHVGEPFHPVVVLNGQLDDVGLKVLKQVGGQEFKACGAPDGVLAHFVEPGDGLRFVEMGVVARGHRSTCLMR